MLFRSADVTLPGRARALGTQHLITQIREEIEDIFAHIRASLDAGAKGVIMGRNIVRHQNVARVCEAIAAIIHDDASVEQAFAILNK